MENQSKKRGQLPSLTKLISFEQADISFSLKHKRILRNWLWSIAKNESREILSVSYAFCSSKYIQEINRTHLSHDYVTDIITFDLSDEPRLIIADIYVCPAFIKEYAFTHQISFEVELKRVLAHGILHLCGYNDGIASEKKVMRKKEDEYLSLFPSS